MIQRSDTIGAKGSGKCTNDQYDVSAEPELEVFPSVRTSVKI